MVDSGDDDPAVAAEKATNGVAVPVPQQLPAVWGLGKEGDPDYDWVRRRLSPHPLQSYTTALTFKSAVGNNSHTRRRGGLAVRGARAAAGYAGERAEWHKLEGKSPVGQSQAGLFFRSGCERLLNHAVNVSDFADIASTSCCAAEALQAFALSMLSKAMTTNRLGGVPIAPWGWAG